ncbi:MAG TPA: cupin domain-containing protein [Stellaceae bacterium]|nr:cupin domain-containing protein [Stellaceae bacterium]
MGGARHQVAPEIAALSIEEIAAKFTARFGEIPPDWDAFADSRREGNRRAQHRFIGAGGSGKHADPNVVPAGNFTLSILLLPPGQGSGAHTHEVEEVFFVLDGALTVFLEDGAGKRVSTRLGKWECISCPAGVLHGFVNEGDAPVYFQIMIGKGRPGPIGFADDDVYADELARTAAMR